ncbi:hypothetical protein G3O08_04420 [Cryomorpha ignava]|uniref:Uncharacterized protein n=1 Tax=Cryomorpha ignava TaxID=101383 RepID=A0A7K3WM74_9FLAO|nr:hypothetical protein [Cryomorpha ignava]NEN22750.1 hypothetical protein [Cryomorpha ignava]
MALSSFSLLFLAFLLNRGFYFESLIFTNLVEILILIGFLSIFHAWALTIFYRNNDKDDSSADSIHSFDLKKQISKHIIFSVAASVLLMVVVKKYYSETLSVLQVLGSYWFGIVCMFGCFKLLSNFSKRRIFREISLNFAIFVTTYLVLGAVLYEHSLIAKFLIDWYPFGNVLINF